MGRAGYLFSDAAHYFSAFVEVSYCSWQKYVPRAAFFFPVYELRADGDGDIFGKMEGKARYKGTEEIFGKSGQKACGVEYRLDGGSCCVGFDILQRSHGSWKLPL